LNTPRWFYAALTACIVVLTLAGTVALLRQPAGRYAAVDVQGVAFGEHRPGVFVLDTQSGRVCAAEVEQKPECELGPPGRP
jgi:hypothetical protein